MSSDHIERRQHPRHAASYAIEVTPLSSDLAAKVEYLRDISDGGISFTTDDGERYQIGQELTVAIKEASSPLKATATIVWIEPAPFKLNAATVGLQFGELIESQSIIG